MAPIDAQELTAATGENDGITSARSASSAGEEHLPDEAQLGGVAHVLAGLVRLEAGGEFIGVVEDFLGGAGHGGHLRVLRSGGHGVDDDAGRHWCRRRRSRADSRRGPRRRTW